MNLIEVHESFENIYIEALMGWIGIEHKDLWVFVFQDKLVIFYH